MTLGEILERFLSGTPIQRKDTWGKEVFIMIKGTRLGLHRKNPEGGTALIKDYPLFDHYFSVDDLRADDWLEVEL